MHPLIWLGAICIAKGIQEMAHWKDQELKWAHNTVDRLSKRVAELEPEPEEEPPVRVVVVNEDKGDV